VSNGHARVGGLTIKAIDLRCLFQDPVSFTPTAVLPVFPYTPKNDKLRNLVHRLGVAETSYIRSPQRLERTPAIKQASSIHSS